MKKYFLVIFILINLLSFGETALPKIEKIVGLKPWWLDSHDNIEGVLEGIGVVYKGKKENLRTEAIELAKREISSIKNTTIDSTLTLEQSNIDKSLSISTIGTTKSEVNAVLVDTYEDENNYYAYMVEFKDSVAKDNFIAFLKNNNKKFLENKNEYIKYLNKIVITAKKRTKITLNAGLNKELQKNEILNVYRLTDPNINPMTKELNDFSKEKVGEVVVSEVFENQSLAYADLYSTFRIKEGDIVVKTGQFKKDKEETHLEKVDKLKKSYDYNLDYEPQVLNVQRAYILGPRQYELSLMSNFNDKLEAEFKTGIFRFIEAGVNMNTNENSGLRGLLKIAFPIFKTTNIGLSYQKDFDTKGESAIVGLLEQNISEGKILLGLNYTSPIDQNGKNETFGASLQIKPDKNVLIGGEYVNQEGSTTNDYSAAKINLKITADTWLGGGVIWGEERTYFVKLSKITIF